MDDASLAGLDFGLHSHTGLDAVAKGSSGWIAKGANQSGTTTDNGARNLEELPLDRVLPERMVPRVDAADINQAKAQVAMRLALINQDLASFGGREYGEMNALRSIQPEFYDWYS